MSYVKTAVLILIITMVFSVVLFYANIMTIISTTKENTQRVLDGFIISNAKEIYSSIKNGNDITTHIDADYFIKNFSNELSLDIHGNMLYSKNKENNVIFYLTNPQTTNQKDNTLRLQTSFDLHIPVSFAGAQLFELVIPMKVKSSYVLRY